MKQPPEKLAPASWKLWLAFCGAAVWSGAVDAASPPSGSTPLVCASCHRAQVVTQPATSMAHALETVAECEILRAHPKLTFRDGAYSYEILREENRSIYKV